MRINSSVGPNIDGGIGQTASAGVVDKILEVEKLPLATAAKRRERVVQERNEFNSLGSMLGDLGGALEGLRSPVSFAKLRADSSHPDILDGVVSGPAKTGTYEFEVSGLAKAEKHLAFGFPDADVTEVGFGFLAIEQGQAEPLEVVIEPGATLKDVADRINTVSSDVRASIINTGAAADPFRLMVSSVKTGEEARISIDPDTTFLEFKNQVAGQNLGLKFEDVEVTRQENQVSDLVEGLALTAKRAEPGTKVQFNVTHDVEATATGIKEFADKYNKVASYIQNQSAIDPATGKSAGTLSADSSLRSVMRTLQGNLSGAVAGGHAGLQNSTFRTLADIGITTNPKTGTLNLDESKLKAALAADYEGVARIFTRTENGEGVAERLSGAVKRLQSSDGGPLKGRLRALDTMIKQQDQHIERQTRRFESREADLRRRFDGLDAKMAVMKGQQEYLAQKFGSSASGDQ